MLMLVNYFSITKLYINFIIRSSCCDIFAFLVILFAVTVIVSLLVSLIFSVGEAIRSRYNNKCLAMFTEEYASKSDDV